MRFDCTSKLMSQILWLQWIAAIGVLVILFVTSLMRGWSSPYIAQLTAEDSPLPITTDQASWVASLLNLGRLFGAVAGAVSSQYLGSKRTLFTVGFPLALGWMFVIIANSVVWIYVARFICGVAMGMAYITFPLYLGEVSSPSIRGTLVTLALSGVPLGTLTGTIMGAYVSMAVFSYVSLVPTVAFIILFVWLPESPHDLTRMDKIEEAKQSILKYNPRADAESEVKSVREFVSASDSITFVERLREFNIPQNRKAGLIIVLLFFFMQFSGLNTVDFYMESILTDAKLTMVKPATMVIIVNVIGTVSGFLAPITADRYGRKKLLIVSSAGVAVSMVALGLHFMFLENDFDSDSLQWLPVVSINVFQVTVSFGIAVVPSMMLSELFAPEIKSIAACLAGLATGIFSFASSKSYQPLIDGIGEAYVFWLHAVLITFCIVFAVTLVPETKGKSLQEIQNTLLRKQTSRLTSR